EIALGARGEGSEFGKLAVAAYKARGGQLCDGCPVGGRGTGGPARKPCQLPGVPHEDGGPEPVDQPAHVVVPVRIADRTEMEGEPVGKGSQVLGKVFRCRNGCTVDAHRDDEDLALQGCGDLDADVVVGIVEPPAT